MKFINAFLVVLFFNIACGQSQKKSIPTPLKEIKNEQKNSSSLKVGAEQTEKYFPLLKSKTIAVVANQTSLINKTHLVDSLLAAGMKIKVVFAPEHGFRGDVDAGEKVANTTDKKTGLHIISLYGKHLQPTAKDMEGIDIVVFDIQDVGTRFYTYTSTMTYMMEACTENNITFLVLDRPNPNGFYVDGPVLEKKYASFSGLHPVPIVHGLTVAEYAEMINGEKWLKNGLQCKLKYILVENYKHSDLYELPVKPSPNLPNMAAVYLYPSLCLFEGTIVSVGRGTEKPFQIIGFPECKNGNYSFTPKSIDGAAKNPLYENKLCKGFDVTQFGEMYIKNAKSLYLFWLKGMYDAAPNKKKFFNNYFSNLSGNTMLEQQIITGAKEEDIKKSWQDGLNKYKVIRKKYLLYEDFE